MARNVLTIQPNERAAFVGKTQSGKTHLAGILAQGIQRLVVIDAKGKLSNLARSAKRDYSWRLTEWGTNDGAKIRRQMEEGGPGRLRVPAPLRGSYEGIFHWCYRLENVTVYIDEMYGTAPGTDPGPWLNALYTRGAEMGIGVWAASQRPRRVPSVMFSESEWKFIFRLPKLDDRRFMAGEIAVDDVPLLPARDFYMYNDGWDVPVLHRSVVERTGRR